MRYIGITGFVSRSEVDAALQALPAGATLMCGVLLSAKTLRGERNRWWRRYPEPDRIPFIFSDDPRCLNLIHFAAGEMGAGMGIVEKLLPLGGPLCHGVQFNGGWPTLAAGASLRNVVLQFKPGISDPDAIVALTRAVGIQKTSVLLDASGGRGESLSPAMMGRHVGWLREREPLLQIGIAGGLCAETLPGIAGLVRDHQLSIDAEGQLRDGDEGGVLNLGKARAYLKAADEIGGWS